MLPYYTTIVVVDIDAKVPLIERQAYAAAQQRQLREHLAPVWGLDPLVSVRVATPDAPPAVGEAQLQLIDQPTMDGALGYHDALPDGTPIDYIFVGLARQLGEAWTSVASHEALEMSVDPFGRRAVQMSDGFWDQEVADRVERTTYSVDGVLLSNFNTPQCFEPPTNRAGVKYDWLGLSTRENQVLAGGYAQRFDPKKGWTQVGTASAYRTAIAQCGASRGARRRAATPQPSIFARLFGRPIFA